MSMRTRLVLSIGFVLASLAACHSPPLVPDRPADSARIPWWHRLPSSSSAPPREIVLHVGCNRSGAGYSLMMTAAVRGLPPAPPAPPGFQPVSLILEEPEYAGGPWTRRRIAFQGVVSLDDFVQICVDISAEFIGRSPGEYKLVHSRVQEILEQRALPEHSDPDAAK